MYATLNTLQISAIIATWIIGIFHSVEGGDKILLSSIKAVTLRAGQRTTSRRENYIPQLRCLSNPCPFEPSSVQCYNKGFDGAHYQWKCEASLPKHLKFDLIQVTCEGYDHPGDKYVLVGSCSLAYSLKKTHHYSHKGHSHHHHHIGFVHPRFVKKTRIEVITAFVLILAFVFLIVLFCRLCSSNFYHLESAAAAPSTPISSAAYGPYAPAYYSEPSSGFWTGAAVGGAAGYLAGGAGAGHYNEMYCYSSDGGDSGGEEISAGFGDGWSR